MKRKGIFIISIIVLVLVSLFINGKNKKYIVYVEDEKFGYDNYHEYELMKQYVYENECAYEQFLPSIWVASCEVFGTEIDMDTNIGYVYAYVLDEEYVKFKDLAYEQSGGHSPVKMKVQIEDDEILLLNYEFPEDGSYYKKSMKELFPTKYYLACEIYDPFDESGNVKLGKQQEEKIKDIWVVDVSKEYMLNISENGSYEIIWTTGDGPDEEFEVHVKERGQLKALNLNLSTSYFCKDFMIWYR